MNKNGVVRQGHVQAVSDSSDRGEVQGLVVKVKPQGDGTIVFDVICRNSKGRVAHRETLFLSPKSPLRPLLMSAKGGLASVSFERTGGLRDRAISIQSLSKEA